jgi:hypothetical protein
VIYKIFWSLFIGVASPILWFLIIFPVALVLVALGSDTLGPSLGVLSTVGWGWPVMLHDFARTGDIAGCLFRWCDSDFRDALYLLYPTPWAMTAYRLLLQKKSGSIVEQAVPADRPRTGSG